MGDEEAKAEKADVEVEVEAETTAETGGDGVTVGKVHISSAQFPMVGTFFSAVILLTAILVPGSSLKNYAYGIAVAVVAMVFSLLGFILNLKEEGGKIGEFNGIFLFVWCFVGACVLTFSGPFKATSNGYFASWCMAISSVMGVGVTGKQAKDLISGIGPILGLGASAVVVICAIIPEIRDDNYRNNGIYALVVSIVTLLVVAFYAYQAQGEEGNEPGKVKFFVLAFFAILWIVLASLVTFKGPFRGTGNGYFGSWLGAIMSVWAAMGAKGKE